MQNVLLYATSLASIMLEIHKEAIADFTTYDNIGK